MIWADPGNRRADTMTIVGEGLARRHYFTGEYRLVAKACGYLDLALKNLAELFDAGLIEEVGIPERDSWYRLAWTKAGKALWEQWKQGSPRAIVELPEVTPDGGGIPVASERMLTDAGWSILNAWKNFSWHDEGGWVVEVMYRDTTKPTRDRERVMLLDKRGLTILDLSRAEALVMGATIIAAAR